MLPRPLTAAVRCAATMVTLAAVTVAAGCSGTRDGTQADNPHSIPASAAPAGPPEVTAALATSRRDEALGQVRILLTNVGDDPIAVDGIRLIAPPYSPAAARISGGALPAGRTIAYPVEHGEPDCAGTNPSAGPLRVEVDAGPHQVTLDPGESTALIDRMLTLDCGRQKIAELVTIALDHEWDVAAGGDEQTGTLTITRRKEGPPLTVTAVRGGINYTLALVDPNAQPTLEPGQESMSVPVRSRGARCDGHAVGDNSKPYTFTAWITVAGGPETHVEFNAQDQAANFDRLCEVA